MNNLFREKEGCIKIEKGDLRTQSNIIAQGYKIAADRLVENISKVTNQESTKYNLEISDELLEFATQNAIVFLYRQYVELTLKHLIYFANLKVDEDGYPLVDINGNKLPKNIVNIIKSKKLNPENVNEQISVNDIQIETSRNDCEATKEFIVDVLNTIYKIKEFREKNEKNMSHNLMKLFKNLEEVFNNMDDTIYSKSIQDTDNEKVKEVKQEILNLLSDIKPYIEEFDQYDSTSFTFRYPYEKDFTEVKNPFNKIDLEYLKNGTNELYQKLSASNNSIDVIINLLVNT